MSNRLSKDKTFLSYTPAVQARAGVPGRPAVPARAVTELVPVRTEVPASAMEVLYGAPDRLTGQLIYTPYRTERTTTQIISSPLVKLREVLRRPGLTAAQAHYSQVLGLVKINDSDVLLPLTWTSAWIEEMRWTTTVLPAQPAVAAIPAVAGSPAVMTYDMHLGWNAGAYSEAILEPGSNYAITFTVGRNIGSVIGLARASRLAGVARRNGYAHIETGIAVGEGRARLVRNGEFARNAWGQLIEIEGAADIEGFKVDLAHGVATWQHAGAVLATVTLDASQKYVLDAVLFSADDYVDSPAIKLVAPPVGDISGSSKHRGLTLHARMESPGQLHTSIQALQLRAGSAYSDIVAATAPLAVAAAASGVSTARLGMRAIGVAAGVIPLGVGDLRMRAMTLEGESDDAWVPTYALGVPTLHAPVLAGGVLSGGVMTGDLQLQPLWGRMSQGVYGEAVLGLEHLQLVGGLITGTGPVDMIERMIPDNAVEQRIYITVVVNERVRGRDTAGHQVLAVVSILEQLETEDPTSVAQRALALALEQIGAMGPARALTFRVEDGGWSLVDDSEGWALNTETGGSTRYEGFGFDSFATVKGRHLGVRSDGVYLLEGDTDAGRPIHAGVHLGKQDFGTSQLKPISNVYLGVSSQGQLFLKVGTDQASFTYAARRVDPALKTQRYDLGRGLRSNYYTFDLVNEDGAGFELEKIEFVLAASSRRI